MRDDLEFALTELSRRLRRHEVAEHRVLLVVAHLDRLSQDAMADRTGLDRTTVSRAVRNLERRGALAREPDAVDGRKRLVVAGSATRAAALESARRAQAVEREAFARLKEMELGHVRRLLRKAL